VQARTWELTGSLIEDGNHLMDQIRVAKTLGSVQDAVEVLRRIEEFQKAHAGSLPLNLSTGKEDLVELVKVSSALGTSKRTQADSARRILRSYQALNRGGRSTAPEKIRKGLAPEVQATLALYDRIAGAALKSRRKRIVFALPAVTRRSNSG
jgi:hypothetical protein